MSRVRVQIVGRDRSHLADLRGVHRTGVVRQTARREPDGRWTVQAVARKDQLDALRAAGYDVTELDRARTAGLEDGFELSGRNIARHDRDDVRNSEHPGEDGVGKNLVAR